MEKRAFERIPTGEPVRIFFRKKIYSGTVLNLSETGMFIGTRECFPLDSIIRIESELLKVLVRVKRVTEINGYYDGVGVELSNRSQDYLKYIGSLNFYKS
jgi:hypothetical protein